MTEDERRSFQEACPASERWEWTESVGYRAAMLSHERSHGVWPKPLYGPQAPPHPPREPTPEGMEWPDPEWGERGRDEYDTHTTLDGYPKPGV